MRYSLIGLATATALALAVVGPASAMADDAAGDLGTQLSQTWEALKDYTVEQKNALAEQSEHLLSALDAQIDEAQAAAADATGEAKEKWNATVDNLGEYREEAAERFEALQDSSAEAWDDAKHSLAETLENLQQSLEDEPADQS